MTTAFRVMAAAFCLCGVLFLLQVDPVNSLKCKDCTHANPNCRSGAVADVECASTDTYCATIVIQDENHPMTFRSCSNGEVSGCETTDSQKTACFTSCHTDSCNNESYE